MNLLNEGIYFASATGVNYSNIFSGAQSEAFKGISAAAPVAGIIFGAVLAIGIAIKVFSKLAKKG